MDAIVITRDPICGMIVGPAAGKPHTIHNDQVVHFCCESCYTKFLADPETHSTAVDPVCGADVDRAKAAHMVKHAGVRD